MSCTVELGMIFFINLGPAILVKQKIQAKLVLFHNKITVLKMTLSLDRIVLLYNSSEAHVIQQLRQKIASQ